MPRSGRAASQALVLGRDTRSWGKFAAAAVVLLLAGAGWAYGRSDDEAARRLRIWQALGDKATQAQVTEVEQQAADLQVETDTLLRVRRLCLLRPGKQPDVATMQAAVTAAAAGQRDKALISLAHDRCR